MCPSFWGFQVKEVTQKLIYRILDGKMIYLFIYLFIYLCARKADRFYRCFEKVTVNCENVWNRTYVLHERCDHVTSKNFIFFIDFDCDFLLFSLGCHSQFEGFVAWRCSSYMGWRWWRQFSDNAKVLTVRWY